MKSFDASVYHNPHPDSGEGPFPDSVVEVSGFMTHQQQIDRLVASGEIHSMWRKATFPSDLEVPDDFMPEGFNPTELECLEIAQMVVAGKTRGAARAEVAEKRGSEVPPAPPDPVEAGEPPVDPPVDPGE